MCDFKSWSFFLIILGILQFSALQTPSKRLCFGELEIASFTDEVLFAEANAGCSKYGGSLVKIENSAMQDVIRKVIKVKPMYYIGAMQVNGQYIWLVDKTRVPLRGESGYQNWRLNEPNNYKEKCVAIGVHDTHEWSDVLCSASTTLSFPYSYICQRGSENLLDVSKDGNQVICSVGADGIAIHWTRNSKAVESSVASNRIYQTFEANRAHLHIANANISEIGTYECVSKTDTCSAKKSVPVNVDGNSKIIKICNNKCNSSLLIKWIPAQAAVGFWHRINVFSNISKVTEYATPTSTDIQEKEIDGLNPDSNYTVNIHACLKSCETEFKVEMKTATDGVTKPVSSAYALSDDKGGCRTSWKHTDPDSTFSLQLNCSVAVFRNDEKIFNISVVEGITTTSHRFQLSPNRRCKAAIQAKGCGMISVTVEASGVCNTPAEAPQFINPLIITVERNDASKYITIPKPNEDNGLISCVFIIFCYQKCSDNGFTIDDLKTANKSSGGTNVDGKNAIAMAVPMMSFSEPSRTIELSNGEITSCNVYVTGKSRHTNSSVALLNGTFQGQNNMNSNDAYVGAFIVTTTPSNGRILLKSSVPVTVVDEIKTTTVATETGGGKDDNSTEDNQSGNSLWVIGLIVGILGAIIGVSGFIFARRNQPAMPNNNVAPAAVPAVSANRLQKAVEAQETSLYGYDNDPPAPMYEEIKEPTARPGYGEPSSYENIAT